MSHTTWILLACIWTLAFGSILHTITIIRLVGRVQNVERRSHDHVRTEPPTRDDLVRAWTEPHR